MVDFSLNEKDQEIIQEIRKKGEVLRKYARYYDEHEGEKIPDELPEAKDFDNIAFMNMERMELEGATGPTMVSFQRYMIAGAIP
ncbi:MAG: hypothetical protein JRJ76_12200 [Deltaproteobacteria bacterium]|nr:hypothetical protein [Deltaproteobacteria bacterium]